jgi:hypothetical protein
MRNLKPPADQTQNRLFDADCGAWWLTHLAPEALRRLDQGMEGVLRRSILKLLPAEHVGDHHADQQPAVLLRRVRHRPAGPLLPSRRSAITSLGEG